MAGKLDTELAARTAVALVALQGAVDLLATEIRWAAPASPELLAMIGQHNRLVALVRDLEDMPFAGPAEAVQGREPCR